jgi:hypothetical protein
LLPPSLAWGSLDAGECGGEPPHSKVQATGPWGTCRRGLAMDVSDLRARYEELKAEATLLAGDLLDIPRRVVILNHVYLDSGRNHTFSLIAAHGALWAFGYFEVGGSLGRFIARRYYYDPAERAYRLGLLREFAEAFRRVNRQVCIDSYTNYQFTKQYGHRPGAEEVVPGPLLDALNRVHDARGHRRELSAERRDVFEQSFRCEQEVTVAPGVRDAVRGFQCRIMRFLCLHPVVRFAYFPRFRALLFRDFASKDERIAKGMRAFDLAERAGWPDVSRALQEYGVMDPRQLDAPESRFLEIRDGVVRDAALAAEILRRSAVAGGPSTEAHR